MNIIEIRKILRKAGFYIRRRRASDIKEYDKDCAYEVTLQGRTLFSIDIYAMQTEQDVHDKLAQELPREG